MAVILAVGLSTAFMVLLFINSTAPTTITITSGPKGSVFQNTAEKYKKILAREGVKVKILQSEGSIDNLKKLSDPKVAVDVGFVLGGEAGGVDTSKLMSLGSISYQPLMVFYRGAPRELLSSFKGQHLDIGPEGSGTHTLALALLKLNGIEPGGDTVFVNSMNGGDSVKALLDNRIDAIFVMGDSTSTALLRQLLHTPDIHLFNFTQADGYTRRISYLNKLELPMGALDFGKNIPADNTFLVAPTVELVARDGLHPALSDLLLDAAREVHGTPGIFKKRGEFPTPVAHEIRLSPDASRYYSSGKSFLYRTFPFWLAGLVARALAVIVPLGLFLIPALKMAPAIYRWRVQSSINRWYRVLLDIESETFKYPGDAKKREELLRHLDRIEITVSKTVVPAAFGDLLYALRVHIDFVRDRLKTRPDLLQAAADGALNEPLATGPEASDKPQPLA
ncbi:TAXI family TRAP transporter solute-binding subunit [Crenobacter sp. SG2305]|uniref:TAXI family TRAP transporter solute-binding subunit n=1 Tax=Crenobacter oryzisoli TaxID=3056844 RepID=UPI0025AADB18|nr:TAXI family TRAP transporter solute-binding subunit [Crenobacter sp. SG2305]MDN0085672.1 TAXI family TRAP transporter solute-binding subunit [Crenobacter sp. SG2305]